MIDQDYQWIKTQDNQRLFSGEFTHHFSWWFLGGLVEITEKMFGIFHDIHVIDISWIPWKIMNPLMDCLIFFVVHGSS